ncbi:FkbM family methyltransferase [Pedobacter sp. KLB.chiD]|uniref:FkbM family methyltransferase n=1 Tax=Pedobacter sp. KLB.chiD TaxID=3387402 RepID=UPI00399AE1B8
MYNYIVDWEEFIFISKFLKQDDHVCDIGTNIGFYTIWMSKFIKYGKIHSFEPDDINFNRLENNVKLNALNNIVSLNKLIVSETNGKLNFTEQLDGENHITNNLDSKGVQKDSVQLDTYSEDKQITTFKFVKIDTEGFELSVLMGAKKLLDQKKIKVIQLEINAGLKTSNIEPKDLINYLLSKDYKLCRYDVLNNQLCYTNYQPSKENYFATYDLDGVNSLLSQKNN